MNKLSALLLAISIICSPYAYGAALNPDYIHNQPLPGSPDGWQHGHNRAGFKALEMFAQSRGTLVAYNPDAEIEEDLRYAKTLAAEKTILKTIEKDSEIEKLCTTVRDTDSPYQRTNSALSGSISTPSGRATDLSGRVTDVRSPFSPENTFQATPISEGEYLIEKPKEIKILIDFLIATNDRYNHNFILVDRIDKLHDRLKKGEWVNYELAQLLNKGFERARECLKMQNERFDLEKERNKSHVRLLQCMERNNINPEFTERYYNYHSHLSSPEGSADDDDEIIGDLHIEIKQINRAKK